MSALPSPLTSPSTRGNWSLLDQPPAAAELPKLSRTSFGAAKLPPPVASETQTPSCPNPTMSALPSPFTSARWRGNLSSLDQPPALLPKLPRTSEGAAKLPPLVASETQTPSWPKPRISALPSPFTSPSCRGNLSSLDHP